ncbi:MAG: hypothetical protein KDC66_13440 [Phaeodactylibacter sp.]|nr:hypothetical protein [Phaeodactylibacter sp.]MCB9272732.1 hypothetical protein [Lewinellaceae bacterium]
MIRDLLSHGLKSQTRSSFWQRSLVINILLGLFVAYLMLNFLFLGFFLDKILEEIFPGVPPLEKFNELLLYSMLFSLIFRFLMQSFPLLDIQGYLLLPIRKSRLYHYLLVKSVFNFFNLMPLFFVIPFAIKTVFPQQGSGSAWLAVLLLIVLFNNFMAFYLKRQFSARPLAVLALVVAIGTLGFLDWKSVLPLSAYFGQGIGAVMQQPLWLAVPAVLVAIAYWLTFRLLRRYTYLDAMATGQQSVAQSSQGFSVLTRFGQAGHYLQLELKQIWRNKRPRTMLVLAVLILFYPLMVDEELAAGKTGMALFMVSLAIIFPTASYGQFLISWESQFFNLLMARPVSSRAYLEAKYYLFLLFTSITLLLELLLGLLNYHFIPLVLASGLFSMGVTAYIIMYFATYNTRPVDPGKSAMMNWEGVGASQFILMIPVFLLPMAFYWGVSLLGGPNAALATLAVLGITGIALKNRILPLLQKQFERRKHILATSFKKK